MISYFNTFSDKVDEFVKLSGKFFPTDHKLFPTNAALKLSGVHSPPPPLRKSAFQEVYVVVIQNSYVIVCSELPTSGNDFPTNRIVPQKAYTSSYSKQ